jgi:hypothetical protein
VVTVDDKGYRDSLASAENEVGCRIDGRRFHVYIVRDYSRLIESMHVLSQLVTEAASRNRFTRRSEVAVYGGSSESAIEKTPVVAISEGSSAIAFVARHLAWAIPSASPMHRACPHFL